MCAFMTDGIFYATKFFSNRLIPLCLGGGGAPPTQECLKHQSELHILIWNSRKGYKAVLLGACSAGLLVL